MRTLVLAALAAAVCALIFSVFNLYLLGLSAWTYEFERVQ